MDACCQRFACGGAVLIAWVCLSVSSASGQTAAPASSTTVEVSASELEQIRAELKYLRMRDAQRQAWEDSVVSRLPKVDYQLTSHGTSGDCVSQPAADCTMGSIESCLSGCNSGCGCGCDCGCYPCECPLTPAPCIPCPHVSTVGQNYNLLFFGALKTDMLFNTARPVSPGVPFFLAPNSLTGLGQETVDIHARQTTLGAALVGPQMGNFQSGGTFIAMLFNDNVIADRYGFLPLQAFGELKNDDWRFAAGLQFDVYAPGVPTMLPFSALAGSGNSGNSFRGSVRLERYLHPASDVQWTFQTCLSDPITTTISPTFATLEDNGWPNVEGRVALGLGEIQGAGATAARPFEFGMSGVVGQIRTTPLPPDPRVVANVWGLATDFRYRVNEFWGFQGELYTGESLGTYNGAVLQATNTDTLDGIRSSGGWAEVYFYLTPCLHNHTGYGIDDPLDRDVATSAGALGRTYNSTFYSNLLWDVNQSFRIGFEYTFRQTNYRNAAVPDNEGSGFHTQFQWAF